jgi:hypothetical protein
MTSVLRTFSTTKEGLTLFLKPESPSYITNVINGDDTIVLFPFTYSNGVLDITYSDNNFKEVMVDIANINPSFESTTTIRIVGGPFLVNSLGNTFKDYIRAWRDGTIDAGSPINIHVAPTLLRVQEAALANMDAQNQSYKISTVAPSDGNLITGTTLNNFKTTFIFKSPLIFTIVESGVTKYITFTSNLGQE